MMAPRYEVKGRTAAGRPFGKGVYILDVHEEKAIWLKI